MGSNGGTTAGFSTASHPVAGAPGADVANVPVLTILAHPNLERIGDRALLGGLVVGETVELSRVTPFFQRPRQHQSAPLEDRFVSRQPLRFEPQPDGGCQLNRGASRAEVRVDGQVLAVDQLTLSAAVLDDGAVLELAGRVALLLHRRPPPVASPTPDFGLVGESHGIEAVRAAIARVAPLDVPVLILGATGTGKELVARALHDASPRHRGPFVAVNLGALTPSLAAAELFGARRGAFTGATRDRAGYFAQAAGGTLFLDEIGEAAPEVQVLLLRALERREIAVVGDPAPRPVDVRVVAATDADLDQLVARGRFRAPLVHRLAGYRIPLPLLRHRGGDVARLWVTFLRQALEQQGRVWPPPAAPRRPWLPSALMTRIARAAWPGNVRELHNVAMQMVIDADERGLDADALGSSVDTNRAPPAAAPAIDAEAAPAPRVSPRRKPSQVSEAELLAALRAERFNLKAAAARLRISRTSIYALIERCDRARFASDLPADAIRAAWRRHQGDVAAMVDVLEVSERGLRQRLKDLGLRPGVR